MLSRPKVKVDLRAQQNRGKIIELTNHHDKISYISRLENHDISSVICEILRELDGVRYNSQATKVMIKELGAALEFLIQFHNMAIVNKAQHLGGMKAAVYDRLYALSENCSPKIVDHRNIKLLSELSLWIEGAATKVLSKIKRDSNGKLLKLPDGTYPPIDLLEDAMMKRATGVTKAECALFLQAIYIDINRSISEYEKFKPVIEHITNNSSGDVITKCFAGDLYLQSLKTVFREIIFKDEARYGVLTDDVLRISLTCKTAFGLFGPKRTDSNAIQQQEPEREQQPSNDNESTNSELTKLLKN